MEKRAILTGVLLTGTFLLGGCGSSYAADSSTVYVLKNDRIITTDVEDFDEDSYSTSELKDYVKTAIEEYTSENGSGSVKYKSLSVEDGVASLTISYASAEDYTGFTGIELYTGTVVGALKDGYTFDVSFLTASDGEEISVSEVLDSESLKVVIIKANTTVQVPGTIVYYSYDAGAYPAADDTLVIGQSDPNASDTETEEPQEDTEAVADTETEAAEVSGSVSDDEMLTGDTESSEVTFDFDEDEEGASASEYSDVYTYIIYR